MFFTLLQSFEEWDCNKVKNIGVGNDSAERGVKLSFDFLLTVKNKEKYQNDRELTEQEFQTSQTEINIQKLGFFYNLKNFEL